ncbi:hypothetical protein BJ165DRAFT_1333846 [Panaeolus papilionaceus]|nr:hypothetical protein BJ165DRAFT_1333846 [Panaeolus papilionaceus]
MSSIRPAAQRPIQRLAVATTKTCAGEASAYGKCIVASYTDISKEACKREFEKFKACVTEAVRVAVCVIRRCP